MKDTCFWIAALLSCCLHGLVVGVLVLLCMLYVPPSSPPLALIAYGDSSMEGLHVDTVAADPGAYRYGVEHTPGGDNSTRVAAIEKLAALEPDRPLEARRDVDENPMPNEEKPPSPAFLAPAEQALDLPKPAAEKPRPATASNIQLPGAPGGARMPQGTPSKGGTVGVAEGVREIGAARAPYPRKAVLEGWEGVVKLFLRISVTGKVTEVRLYRSSGYVILDDAALEFGRILKFIPAREYGKPVECTVIWPVRYRLIDR